MIPLIIIRPEPGCTSSVAAARALGLDARGFPLFAVRPLAWEPPPASRFDGLLIGSGNALRHAGPALESFKGLPVHAVGAATAEAARQAGLTVAQTGSGGLQAVLSRAVPGTRLLRLAGAERIALAPPPGVSVEERVVYASEAQPCPPALAALLDAPAIVALHSAEAARHFGAEVDRLGLSRVHLTLVAIGPRVADAAGPGWRAVATAAKPCETALLAKASDLCHTLDGR